MINRFNAFQLKIKRLKSVTADVPTHGNGVDIALTLAADRSLSILGLVPPIDIILQWDPAGRRSK